MTPVAILADDCFTSSSATTSQCAQVLHLGAMSPYPADPHVGAPEDPIDYDHGVNTLLAARDVEESTSPTVHTASPFGI